MPEGAKWLIIRSLALAVLLLVCATGSVRANRAFSSGKAAERRVIVKLHSGQSMVLSAAEAAAQAGPEAAVAAEEPGLTLRRLLPPPLLSAQHSPPLQQIVAALNAIEDVAYAQEDYTILPQRAPNDAMFDKQWGLSAVGAQAAWDLSVGGRVQPNRIAQLLLRVVSPTPPTRQPRRSPQVPTVRPQPPPALVLRPPVRAPPVAGKRAAAARRMVTVCVVDSGIDVGHPQLVGSLHPLRGVNILNTTAGLSDRLGHGTHISGIIAARGNDRGQVAGLTWGAAAGSLVRLLSCKFISDQGYGYTSGAVKCFDYCIAKGADVISASWSAGTYSNPALSNAVTKAGRHGVLVVAAAGNQGFHLSEEPTYPAAYGFTHSNVLIVGSSDPSGKWVESSSWDMQAVHLSAPGTTILSTWPGGFTEYSSGTSMAAPFVSAAAALLVAATGRRVTPLGARQLLLDSVEKLESHVGRCSSGGRLRVDWALQRALRQVLADDPSLDAGANPGKPVVNPVESPPPSPPLPPLPPPPPVPRPPPPPPPPPLAWKQRQPPPRQKGKKAPPPPRWKGRKRPPPPSPSWHTGKHRRRPPPLPPRKKQGQAR